MVREGSAFGDTGRSQGGHREIVSYKPHLCHQLGVTSPLALDGVDQREVPRLQDDMVWGGEVGTSGIWEVEGASGKRQGWWRRQEGRREGLGRG